MICTVTLVVQLMFSSRNNRAFFFENTREICVSLHCIKKMEENSSSYHIVVYYFTKMQPLPNAKKKAASVIFTILCSSMSASLSSKTELLFFV